MGVKILLDAFLIWDKDYMFVKTLALNLKDKKIDLALYCETKDIRTKVETMPFVSDINIETNDSDLSEYEFFISALRDRPVILDDYPKIVSVALLIDLLNRAQSRDEDFITIRENTRFYRDYDFCLSILEYFKNDISQKLISKNTNYICIGNQNLASTVEEEDLIRRGICKELYVDKLIEFLTDIKKKREIEPRVTVVTITYNLIKNKRKNTIKQCIESVRKQDYKNIEHIIIDGKSTDGTLELLRPYENEGWLKIYSEKDSGIYDAMNKGLKRSTGKYIVYLNSDDYYCDDKAISMAVDRLEAGQFDYLFGNARALLENGKEVIWKGNINLLPYAMNYCHQTLFVKTKVMKELGGFELQYKVSSDSDLMIKLFVNNFRYTVLNKEYIMYRLGGLSTQSAEKSKKDHSNSFYRHIGCKIGLTATECEEIWGKWFLQSYPVKHQIYIIGVLSTLFDIEDIAHSFLNNTMSDLSFKQTAKRLLVIMKRKVKSIVFK